MKCREKVSKGGGKGDIIEGNKITHNIDKTDSELFCSSIL